VARLNQNKQLSKISFKDFAKSVICWERLPQKCPIHAFQEINALGHKIGLYTTSTSKIPDFYNFLGNSV
jgi:hypothetical protein